MAWGEFLRRAPFFLCVGVITGMMVLWPWNGSRLL